MLNKTRHSSPHLLKKRPCSTRRHRKWWWLMLSVTDNETWPKKKFPQRKFHRVMRQCCRKLILDTPAAGQYTTAMKETCSPHFKWFEVHKALNWNTCESKLVEFLIQENQTYPISQTRCHGSSWWDIGSAVSPVPGRIRTKTAYQYVQNWKENHISQRRPKSLELHVLEPWKQGQIALRKLYLLNYRWYLYPPDRTLQFFWGCGFGAPPPNPTLVRAAERHSKTSWG